MYSRGEVLRTHCETLLKQAEMRIEKIALGTDGSPKGVVPLDPQ
jgi:exodeoxyribonuclease VII small subunit